MFTDPEINIPVIGLIENMSYFIGDDGKKYEIFGSGGGKKCASDFKIELFGNIPLVQSIREHGDIGKPYVLDENNRDSQISKEFMKIAESIALKLARLNHHLNSSRENVVFEELDLM
jgi:ATP-binding protein involved in chromosome partitioning